MMTFCASRTPASAAGTRPLRRKPTPRRWRRAPAWATRLRPGSARTRRGGRKCLNGDPLWHLCHTLKLGPDQPAPFSVDELPTDLMLKGQEMAQGGGGWGNAGTRAPLLLPPFCPLPIPQGQNLALSPSHGGQSLWDRRPAVPLQPPPPCSAFPPFLCLYRACARPHRLTDPSASSASSPSPPRFILAARGARAGGRRVGLWRRRHKRRQGWRRRLLLHGPHHVRCLPPRA